MVSSSRLRSGHAAVRRSRRLLRALTKLAAEKLKGRTLAEETVTAIRSGVYEQPEQPV
ncbi:hypothetical protein [Nocardioides iriomotensis]|uniref:hypothetical protein n=1 Tax=Nocardioides iriomotensis TaxID=715784 RepID=UPI0013E9C3E7|nr:hypothetical protein [Nocardioides iriomotensis]